jgi:2-dehydro-3-deoxy-D-arabinonate dehydratase
MHKLYRMASGVVLETDGRRYELALPWNALIDVEDLPALLGEAPRWARRMDGELALDGSLLLPPVCEPQEVWAAGVTYLRSREARREESKSAGGGDFYDRVYSADRPELFFKANAGRVVGSGAAVRIRQDARWSVPEPELALVINKRGRIVGYTIGNDMSSRDIEGENPLYLPQAKVYDGSCALGPCMLVSKGPLPRETEIRLEIRRGGRAAFTGATSLAQMKRTLQELVDYLYRDNTYPAGCVLLTGTGVVPPDSFTLDHGDEVRITIEPIGTLVNVVA